jgi:predicted RNA binding protein YcfA (HicA-like mRNA interferase family)
MPKLPVLTAKELCNMLVRYGCVVLSVRGSHHKIRNPDNGRVSVIAIHSGKDVGKGAFAAILQQLGIDANKILEFMK